MDTKIPVMHTQTRQEIYKVLLLLCEDETNYDNMLELLEDVIPQGMSSTYSPQVITVSHCF